MPETKSLTIRAVEEDIAREFAAGAAIRGITQAEYLKRLLRFRMLASVHLRGTRDTPDEQRVDDHKTLAGFMASLDLWDMSA